MSLPWEVAGWFGSRVRELLYQGLSWGYLIAITMTVLFIAGLIWKPLTPHLPIIRDTMVFSWGMAFGKRVIADKWTVEK